ncbi:MAG TPA: MlaD family protein [Thermoleophilaceae bacterium]|nr:MlaD family protein [Thermoleophilaceae bacterium]
MVKETPSVGRIAAMVGFTLSCVGILLFLWLSFGGTIPLRPEAYRFTAAFPEASTLVEEADVRLAGVNVGKVKTRELAKDGGRSVVEIELTEAYAPIPRDTKAILRQKTLLGETYVELTPGDPEAGMLGDGERLPRSNVKLTVELDEIYRIFDESTRKDFRGWVKEGSVAVAGDYAEDLNDAIGNLAPFATDGARLLTILDDQKGAVRGVVRDTGRVFNALAAEEGQLQGLIQNGNETFDALASRDDALADTFQVFPTFLRETRSTLGRLETFARDTRPLVNDLKGPADDLGPTVRDLGDLAPDLQQLYRDLDPLIVAGNRGLPQGERFLRGSQPVFTALHNFLPELNPILAYLSFSRQQVAQFITVGGAALAGNGTGGYQAPRGAEHWLPQIALIDGQSFSRNTSRPSTDRGNAYVQPNAYQRSIPLGVIESIDCPNGEQRDPKDTAAPGPLAFTNAGAEPPCFEAPRSLYQNQKYARLRRGRAPVVPAPQGRDGTERATP